MTVEGEVILVRKGMGVPEMHMIGMDHVLLQLRDNFFKEGQEKIVLECEFKLPKLYKTNKQLRYLFGILAPKFFAYLKDAGYSVRSKDQAIRDIAAVTFGLVEDFVDPKTGEIKSIPIRISKATKEQMTNFIQELFLFLVENGIEVMSADEYNRRVTKWK